MSPKRLAIEILERRKAMIDALITFVSKHPNAAAGTLVKGLNDGKNGLSFPDYALIVPYWNNGDVQLRLLKSGEDWLFGPNSEAYEKLDKLVAKDVSDMTDHELEHLLNEMCQEANGEDESDSG